MNIKHYSFVLSMLAVAATATAQSSATLNKQQSFPSAMPAGNYSGITRLHGNTYALVSDKSEKEGFYLFDIRIDSVSGQIKSAEYLDFKGSSPEKRDCEGIAYLPSTNTVVISGEADNTIREYDMDGRPTGRTISLPPADGNYGYESLTYNDATRTLWTCTENVLPSDSSLYVGGKPASLIRLRSFDTGFLPRKEYFYRLDAPQKSGIKGRYAHGISELLALDDGSLLVLEREFAIPTLILGASDVCKLYVVNPQSDYGLVSARQSGQSAGHAVVLPKRLLCRWTTRLSLFENSLANYEGMCLGPKLSDGAQTVVLVSDSQNRAGGILKDWFRTIVLR